MHMIERDYLSFFRDPVLVKTNVYSRILYSLHHFLINYFLFIPVSGSFTPAFSHADVAFSIHASSNASFDHSIDEQTVDQKATTNKGQKEDEP